MPSLHATASIIVEAKQVGQRRPLLPALRVPLPPDPEPPGQRLTLRALIARIVQAEVDAFRQRQEQSRLVSVLTESQIQQAAGSGKISLGGAELQQPVDTDAAVATALQAFEDGLYVVFVDDEQCADLSAEVFLKPDSRVLFVRLVALAGG